MVFDYFSMPLLVLSPTTEAWLVDSLIVSHLSLRCMLQVTTPCNGAAMGDLQRQKWLPCYEHLQGQKSNTVQGCDATAES